MDIKNRLDITEIFCQLDNFYQTFEYHDRTPVSDLAENLFGKPQFEGRVTFAPDGGDLHIVVR